MALLIKPKNNSLQRCYACQQQFRYDPLYANSSCYLHYVTSKFGSHVEYVKAQVELPLCPECESNKSMKYVFPVVIFGVLVLLLLVLLCMGCGADNFMLGVLLAAIVALVSLPFSIWASAVISRRNAHSDFPPVQGLKDLGFVTGSEPTKYSKEMGPIAQDSYRWFYSEIIVPNNCEVLETD